MVVPPLELEGFTLSKKGQFGVPTSKKEDLRIFLAVFFLFVLFLNGC